MTIETQPDRTTASSKPRRWFRFRLRTLLFFITLLSIPLGWVGWELDQRRREKVTIAWIEEMGGDVGFFNGVFPPSIRDQRSWWEKAKGNLFGERVQSVMLNNPQRIDNQQLIDISPLAALKSLELLWIFNPHVTIEQVNELSLELPNCKIGSFNQIPAQGQVNTDTTNPIKTTLNKRE